MALYKADLVSLARDFSSFESGHAEDGEVAVISESADAVDQVLQEIACAYKSGNDSELKKRLVQFSVMSYDVKMPYSREFERRSIALMLMKCLDSGDRELRKITLEALTNLTNLTDKRYASVLVGAGMNAYLVDLAKERDVECIDSVFAVIANVCCLMGDMRRFFFASIKISDVYELIIGLCEGHALNGLPDYLWCLGPILAKEGLEFCRFLIQMAQRYPRELLSMNGLFQALCICADDEHFVSIASESGLAESLAKFLGIRDNEPVLLVILVVFGEIAKVHRDPSFLIDPILALIVEQQSSRIILASIYCLTKLILGKPELVPCLVDKGLISMLMKHIQGKQCIFLNHASMCLAVIICASPELVLEQLDSNFILGFLLEIVSTWNTDISLHVRAIFLILCYTVSQNGLDSTREAFATLDGPETLFPFLGKYPDVDAAITNIQTLLQLTDVV